jgi:glycosyltransferase involved in cell wall biosynthesis
MRVTHSIVIPVYRNEEFLPDVVRAVEDIARGTDGTVEAVFVVDGSPDRSEAWLLGNLPRLAVPSQLVALSRNFGSFAAIRWGLGAARGERIAVMAADLQEPPSLIVDFFRALADGHDVAVGIRTGRDDPWADRASARLFWRAYRRMVQPEMPSEGVDVFAVSSAARDALLALNESHSSLVAQLLWIGFSRAEVPYRRAPRQHGASGWTLRRKLAYFFDSIFSFTHIPITLLTLIGFLGTLGFLALGVALLAARFMGLIAVPGYTAIMVTILFSASLVLFGLGIVGSYVWRAYENTKGRPLGIVRAQRAFAGTAAGEHDGP